MAVAAITKPLDRWDLIADRVLGVPELGWAIAEANPDLLGYLILPAGITLNVPDLATLRRPLTAANPAREDDGDFLPLLPDDTPAPIPTTGGGGVVGDFVPLSAVGVTVAPLFNNLVPIGYLPSYPTAASLDVVTNSTFNAVLIDIDTALTAKLNTSTYTAGIATKLDTSVYTAGIATKLDASARNSAGGVAGLDSNLLIAAAQIPIAVQFQHLIRSSGSAFDFNVLNVGSAAIKWIDTNAGNTNNPTFGSTGALLQYDPLFGVSGSNNLYKMQVLANYGSQRIADRQQVNGTWGPWYERAYLNKSQAFINLQDFAAAATFKGGNTPAATLSLTQAGVDAAGQPRYWLINAGATAGNRVKSLTVSSSGNIIFGHHADDGTAGVQVELTASGNLLTAGTVRPGSGSTAFSGAQFLPGAFYFRTDLLGDSGSGCATYSDGVIWRRVGDGTATTEEPRIRKTIRGTTAATQGATASIAHGLGASNTKVVSVTGVIYYATGQVVPINGRQAGYSTVWATDTANFTLTNDSTSSGSILSKPFTVTIEYTA